MALDYLTRNGRRKFVLGLVFMFLTSLEVGGVVFAVTIGSATGWEAAGVASLIGAQAAGVGAIVYGNVKEHQAKALANGGSG